MELSIDARVIVTCWFTNGPKNSLKVGGQGSQSILSPRATAAMDELVQNGFVVAEEFNQYGRMLYTGTDKCRGVVLTLDEMDVHGKWSATIPNPDTPPKAEPGPLASIRLG